MQTSPSRRAGWGVLTLTLAALTATLLIAWRYELGLAATVVALPLTLVALYLAWMQVRTAQQQAASAAAGQLSLAQVADQLADAVRIQWEAEAAHQRLNDPHPLPIAWSPADPDLVERWHDLVITTHGWPGGPLTDPAIWAAGPAGLEGSDNDLADVLARVPTGRLVVLGGPGAGKTMLLIRLLLDLLARRAQGGGGPVPVLVGLASWNPVDHDLATWLTQRLVQDHPELAAPAPPGTGASSSARALLDQRLLLPILDGLDELPEQMVGQAITRLNTALPPGQGLVLASRTAAYRHAITGQLCHPRQPATEAGTPGSVPVRLWGAAGIILRPLAPVDVRFYLRRDAAGPTMATRWDPVLAALGTSTPVGQALTSPLSVALARTIYNPRPGEHPGGLPDPAELCDQPRFPTPGAIQAYLFDAFIPAAYRPHPNPRRQGRWTADQAEQWLGFLAHHLHHDRNDTTDLAWWRLRDAAPKPLTGLLVGLVAGIAGAITLPWPGMGFGFIIALLAALLIRHYLPARRPGLVSGAAGATVGSLLAALVALLVFGIGPSAVRLESILTAAIGVTIAVAATSHFTAAAVGAFAGEAVTAFYEQASFFADVRTAIGSRAHLINGIGVGLAVGLAAGVFNRGEPARGFRWTPAGFAFGIACGAIIAATVWLQAGITPGLVAGTIAAFAGGLLVSLFSASPIHPGTASSPKAVLVRDRKMFLAAFSAAVPAGASFAFATAMSPQGLRFGLMFGVANAIEIGLGLAFFQTEWGAFTIARWWMAIRRRLPLRLIAFLEDAHVNHGALRQFGAVYQFRHAELQHRLAHRSLRRTS